MLFSNKILPYLAVSFLVASVTGDVVEYLCCETEDQCGFTPPGPPPPGEEPPEPPSTEEPRPGCKYYYDDPFPNTKQEIRQLCNDKPDGMTHTCLDTDQIKRGKIFADFWCCAECPDPAHHTSDEADEMLSACPYYYGRGKIKDVENACEKFTVMSDPLDGQSASPPVGFETCKVISSVFGGADPHFKTWAGEWYDFHGMCDLVMLDVPDFGSGQGLTIHARTKGRYDYSYIESAAIKIADDIFQLSSYGDYVLNGVSQAELPATIGGYTIRQTVENDDRESHFEIIITEHKSIEISTFKDLVNVRTPVLNHAEFSTSKGLFGAFPSGALVGRDGTTVFTDHNEFGQEWQVLDSEPKLFQVVDHFPQHPQHKCVLPDPTKDARRRLGETVAREAADSACSHWGHLKEMCIMDVMATGDIEIAQSNHQMLL